MTRIPFAHMGVSYPAGKGIDFLVGCGRIRIGRKIGREGGEEMRQAGKVRFDLELAEGVVDSFSSLSGVQVRLYASDGTLLYERGEQSSCCEVCRQTVRLTAQDTQCEQVHQHGMKHAEQFGGRYIYFCPTGMTFFSSPIIIGGAQTGAFVCGPVLLMEREDYLEEEFVQLNVRSQRDRLAFLQAVESVPQIEPRQMNYLSQQLFANAVYVSDSVQELLVLRNSNQDQGMISDYIQQLKRSQAPKGYPVRQEQELLVAISKCNRPEAEARLNEVLSNLFYSYNTVTEIDERIVELEILMSRAAIYSGADMEQVFKLNGRFVQQTKMLHRQEDMTLWVQAVLRHFLNMVQTPPDTKHRNLIYAAIGYMQTKYREPLTLEQVADYIGYSPSYFSKVFKQETGNTFRTYLNYLRIEKSKSLLLSSQVPVSDICAMVAFEDQSYFSKVFKRFVGVTPDRYRKRERRLDPVKEHGGEEAKRRRAVK